MSLRPRRMCLRRAEWRESVPSRVPSRVPSVVPSRMDPYEFFKDGHILARLSGAAKLGQFTAYEKMEVTAEGRRRGYFSFQRGERVHTPQSKMEGSQRVQLPVRDGLLHSILLGERTTGAKKSSPTQKDLLCLSFVQKRSHYSSGITDPLGGPDSRKDSGIWARGFDHNSFESLTRPSDFVWVVTPPLHTSPDEYIWSDCVLPSDDIDFAPPPDGRTYTYDIGAYKGGSRPTGGDFLESNNLELHQAGDKLFDLMECAFTTYTVPSVTTAVGQSKRSMVPNSRKSSKKQRLSEPAAPASAPAKSARAVTSSAKGKASCRALTAPAKAASRARAAQKARADDSEEEWRTDDEDEDDDFEHDEYGLVDDRLSTPPSCSDSRSCSRSRSRSQSPMPSEPSLPPSTPGEGQ